VRIHDKRSSAEEPERQRGRRRGSEDLTGPRSDDSPQHFRGHHGPASRQRDHGGRGGGHGRGRAQRGDVRTAILLLLAEQPMHGYQLMQAITDRTRGAWRPSPGAVYPTIDQLEDEGLATIQAEGGRRLVTLTPQGHAHLAEHGAELSDPFAEFADGAGGPDLREPLDQLHVAARQIAVSGSTPQLEAAARVLAQARRSLYLILAGESEGADE
jgi:DNA-binding PadR family transcriptional regulator